MSGHAWAVSWMCCDGPWTSWSGTVRTVSLSPNQRLVLCFTAYCRVRYYVNKAYCIVCVSGHFS